MLIDNSAISIFIYKLNTHEIVFFSLYSCNKEEKLVSGNTIFAVISTLLCDRYVPKILTWKTFIKGYTTMSQDFHLPDLDLIFTFTPIHIIFKRQIIQV